MNRASVRFILEKLITDAGTQHLAAKKLGISGAYFSDLYYGRREPGPKVLKALGLKRVVAYERVA